MAEIFDATEYLRVRRQMEWVAPEVAKYNDQAVIWAIDELYRYVHIRNPYPLTLTWEYVLHVSSNELFTQLVDWWESRNGCS